jgi:hypothetical protein
VALLASIAIPGPATAEECFPGSVVGRSAPLYLEQDDGRITGIVRRSDASDIRVCRMEGEWARVKIDFTYYWMKTMDLRVKPADEVVLVLNLPRNVAPPESFEWCREAVVTTPQAAFLAGIATKVADVIPLRQGTLLLACGESGQWILAQHGGLSGFVDRASVRVSTAERPRAIGFVRRRVCKSFLWPAKLLEEQDLVRWHENKVLRVARIPTGTSVRVAEQAGEWVWILFAGEWGFVRAQAVQLSGATRMETDPLKPAEDCSGNFRRAVLRTGTREVFTSAGVGEVVAVVPAGAEFVVFDWNAEWIRAFYLGRTGWVQRAGIDFVSAEEPRWIDFEPYPADESLLEPGLRGFRREDPLASARFGVGAAVSGDRDGIGVTLDAGIAFRLASRTDLVAGMYGLDSDGSVLGGPEIGVEQVVAPLGRAAVLLLRVTGGPHFSGEGGRELTLGWNALAGIETEMTRNAGVGLGYSVRGEHRVACRDDPCPGKKRLLFHGMNLSVRVGF